MAADTITIASRTTRALSSIVIAVVLISIVVAVVKGGIELWNIPPLAFIALVAWAVYWMPAVIVSYQNVVLRNVIRTITIPWTEVEQVDTRFGLGVVADGRTYRAWTGTTPWSRPRRSDIQSARVMPGAERMVERLHAKEAEIVAENERVNRAGEATTIVAGRWDEIRAEGLLEEMTPGRVRVRWHIEIILAAAALIAVTVFATLAL